MKTQWGMRTFSIPIAMEQHDQRHRPSIGRLRNKHMGITRLGTNDMAGSSRILSSGFAALSPLSKDAEREQYKADVGATGWNGTAPEMQQR